MPDGYLVSVGVKADFSDLKNASKEATATVKEAEAAWKEAYAALGKAAEAGSAQAQAALKEYEDALIKAKAEEAAVNDVATAATKAAKDAKLADAAASRTAAAAQRELNQQTGVASMNMRVLEGSTMGAARAAGQFAVRSLGLGEILGSSFGAAAFGAIGLTMIVVSLLEMGQRCAKRGREHYPAIPKLPTITLDSVTTLST